MRRFLVVSHTNHSMGNVSTTTATVTGPEGLRALSGSEAVDAGLMPKAIDVHWHDPAGVSRRLTYVHGTEKKVLIVDPSADYYSNICDLTKSEYVHACPSDDYYYTWYEAPDGAEVKIAYREVWYEIGEHKQTVEFTVTIGADGTPRRPEQMLHIGIPDANASKHPAPMTDYRWSRFVTQTFHTRWYEPVDDEERQFRRELREEHATPQK